MSAEDTQDTPRIIPTPRTGSRARIVVVEFGRRYGKTASTLRSQSGGPTLIILKRARASDGAEYWTRDKRPPRS